MKHFSITLSSRYRGALWKIAACFFFAANNGVVKHLSMPSSNGASLSSYQVAFWQNFVGFLMMLPFVLPKGIKSLSIVQPSLHFYRVLSAVIGVVLWYLAIAQMPMAHAVALGFTGPIFTVVGSRLYLGEKISIFRGIGIALGIFGAFIITRPDKILWAEDHDLSWIILLPLTSALVLAMTKLLGRKLSTAGESPENLTFYLLLFMAPLSLIPALSHWQTPHGEQWLWILLLGFLSAGAHYTTSFAYKAAEVTFLAPLGFTRLIFTAALGFVFFQELPTSIELWVGAFVIMIGSLCLSLESTRSLLKLHSPIFKYLRQKPNN